MHVTIVHVQVKPEHVHDFIEAGRLNHEGSVREPGNRRFDILQSADDPTKFALYEAYASAEDAATHKATPHYLAPSARGERATPFRGEASSKGGCRAATRNQVHVSRTGRQPPKALSPRAVAALRQWAQIAAMNHVSLGATAAVSERAAPRDPAAIWRDTVAPWMAGPRQGVPYKGLYPKA